MFSLFVEFFAFFRFEWAMVPPRASARQARGKGRAGAEGSRGRGGARGGRGRGDGDGGVTPEGAALAEAEREEQAAEAARVEARENLAQEEAARTAELHRAMEVEQEAQRGAMEAATAAELARGVADGVPRSMANVVGGVESNASLQARELEEVAVAAQRSAVDAREQRDVAMAERDSALSAARLRLAEVEKELASARSLAAVELRSVQQEAAIASASAATANQARRSAEATTSALRAEAARAYLRTTARPAGDLGVARPGTLQVCPNFSLFPSLVFVFRWFFLLIFVDTEL